MPTYKTPGVYVEEISTLPPSVAQVATAVPAFLGHTEKGPSIKRIDTFLDYLEHFGAAKPTSFKATTSDASSVTVESQAGEHDPEYLMYYCLSMYFKNGGGSCYVISVGDYKATPAKAGFEAGLALLEKEDEPTLILLTDAVNLSEPDYYSVCQQALAQCGKLGDRFAVLDVLHGDDKVDEFRQQIGTNDLMYGAVYTPYLKTSLNVVYEDGGVVIEGAGGTAASWSKTFGGVVVGYTGSETPRVKIVQGDSGADLSFSIEDSELTIRNVNGRDGSVVAAAWGLFVASSESEGFEVAVADAAADVEHTSGSFDDLVKGAGGGGGTTLAAIEATQTALYQQVKAALTAERVVLPPSAAVAGVYASTDRKRGVWKAPANVSLAATIAPAEKITSNAQEGLNVDPTAGKSINAIREFTGKGTLVWGARTLAGNDNEWRYVSVRRLFNMVEESARKSTAFAVFEPNDATTWLKVKGMIESFLYGLWEQGAFAGPSPETAYFVNVGLGRTMTAQDVLEGRMIVEIGVAASRPAEFIVLRFSHKLQEA